MGDSIFDKITSGDLYFAKDIGKWIDKTVKTFIGNDEDNSILLYDFVSSYKNLYDQFKEEYDNLEKLNIGYYNNIIEYIDGKDFRMLSLQLNEQEEDSIVPGKEYNRLIIRERYDCKNEAIEAYFVTGSTNDSKSKKLTGVNTDVLRGYLDLFGKYYPLFDLYRDINMGGCYNHSQSITFKIIGKNNSLINGLDSIEIFISSHYVMNINHSTLINVDLSDGIKVNPSKSIAKIDDLEVLAFSNYILKPTLETALNTIKVNRDYIRNYDLDKYSENIKTK